MRSGSRRTGVAMHNVWGMKWGNGVPMAHEEHPKGREGHILLVREGSNPTAAKAAT